MVDYTERLNDLEQTESGSRNPTFPFDSPKEWEEGTGKLMIAEVIKIQKGVGNSGEYDIMTVKPLEGNFEIDSQRLSVFVTGTLRQAVISQKVAEGDTIGIKYHGHQEADNKSGYIHDFTLDVYERGDGKPLFDPEEVDIPF